MADVSGITAALPQTTQQNPLQNVSTIVGIQNDMVRNKLLQQDILNQQQSLSASQTSQEKVRQDISTARLNMVRGTMHAMAYMDPAKLTPDVARGMVDGLVQAGVASPTEADWFKNQVKDDMTGQDLTNLAGLVGFQMEHPEVQQRMATPARQSFNAGGYTGMTQTQNPGTPNAGMANVPQSQPIAENTAAPSLQKVFKPDPRDPSGKTGWFVIEPVAGGGMPGGPSIGTAPAAAPAAGAVPAIGGPPGAVPVVGGPGGPPGAVPVVGGPGGPPGAVPVVGGPGGPPGAVPVVGGAPGAALAGNVSGVGNQPVGALAGPPVGSETEIPANVKQYQADQAQVQPFWNTIRVADQARAALAMARTGKGTQDWYNLGQTLQSWGWIPSGSEWAKSINAQADAVKLTSQLILNNPMGASSDARLDTALKGSATTGIPNEVAESILRDNIIAPARQHIAQVRQATDPTYFNGGVAPGVNGYTNHVTQFQGSMGEVGHLAYVWDKLSDPDRIKIMDSLDKSPKLKAEFMKHLTVAKRYFFPDQQ